MTRKPVLLLALVVAACGGARSSVQPATLPQPVAKSSPSADAGSVGDAAAAAAPSADSRFDIADRGAAPRRDLARAFHAGTEQRLDLSTVTRVMHKGAELAASVVEAPVEVRIRGVSQSGVASFDAALGPFHYRTRGDPQLVRMMTQGAARAGVLGDTIRGHATITGHGLIEHAAFEGSKKDQNAVAMALAASLMSAAEELPPGELGSGARWRVHSSAQVRGDQVDLVARYQIVSLTDQDVRLRVEHEQPEFAPGPSADQPRVVKKDSEGEWLYRQGRVFPDGSEILKRPLPIPGTHDLELWSEVHLVASTAL